MKIKSGTWLADLIEVYNTLGGEAAYKDVYLTAKKKRLEVGRSWTPKSTATIRRTIENHSSDSDVFNGKDIFYSVKGLGSGIWGLLPEFIEVEKEEVQKGGKAYLQGIEGITQESKYLKKSRDPRLVEERKQRDNFTCKACDFKLKIREGKYIIDVHHLNPISKLSDVTITNIEDLVCLCPNCHRVAHSNKEQPLTLSEIKKLIAHMS